MLGAFVNAEGADAAPADGAPADGVAVDGGKSVVEVAAAHIVPVAVVSPCSSADGVRWLVAAASAAGAHSLVLELQLALTLTLELQLARILELAGSQAEGAAVLAPLL